MAGTKKKSLFEMFVGQYVRVTVKLAISSSDGEYARSSPLSLSGYLIEEVEDCYVLGDTPETYSFAIKREDVSVLEIAVKKDTLDSLLTEFERPE